MTFATTSSSLPQKSPVEMVTRVVSSTRDVNSHSTGLRYEFLEHLFSKIDELETARLTVTWHHDHSVSIFLSHFDQRVWIAVNVGIRSISCRTHRSANPSGRRPRVRCIASQPRPEPPPCESLPQGHRHAAGEPVESVRTRGAGRHAAAAGLSPLHTERPQECRLTPKYSAFCA